MSGKTVRSAISRLLVVSLGLALVPTPALAESSDQIRAELQTAQQTLNDLYQQAEAVSEELNSVRVQLDETSASIDKLDGEIEKTEADLGVAKQELSSTMSWSYKSQPTFLSLVLSSSTVDELLSNVYYANKVTASQTEKIDRVNDLRGQLDEQMVELQQTKTDQEDLLARQEERQQELDAAASEAEDYVAGLSSELRDALAAEEAARQEALRRAAEEAAARAAAEAARVEAEQRRAVEESAASAEQEARQAAEAAEAAAAAAESYAADATTDYYGAASVGGYSSTPSDVAAIVVSAAFAELGKPYVWGAEGPSSFDCSGLVMWCYAQAGISVPHYSGSQSAYCNKPASAAVAGDIVWRQGHVGLCIGDGQVIEALPGSGVAFGTVYDFTLAGSPA